MADEHMHELLKVPMSPTPSPATIQSLWIEGRRRRRRARSARVVGLVSAIAVLTVGALGVHHRSASVVETNAPLAVDPPMSPTLPVASHTDAQPTTRLHIDRIDVDVPVADHATADPRTSMPDGPVHLPATAPIGTPGTAVVVGHRTTFTAPFLRLDELRAGDSVVVTVAGRTLLFVVTKTRVVQATGASTAPSFGVPPELLSDDGVHPEQPRLRLVTFHPRYSAAQRLVVDAVLAQA